MDARSGRTVDPAASGRVGGRQDRSVRTPSGAGYYRPAIVSEGVRACVRARAAAVPRVWADGRAGVGLSSRCARTHIEIAASATTSSYERAGPAPDKASEDAIGLGSCYCIWSGFSERVG